MSEASQPGSGRAVNRLVRAGRIPAVALALVAGCSSYSGPAARYAQVEESTATALIPFGRLPYRFCRKKAAYRYFGEILDTQPRNAATGQPWPVWYASAPARTAPSGSVTWLSECREATEAGAAVLTVLRALRAHARAVAALAEGKDFDASGLESVGTAVGSTGTALGASGDFSSTAAGLGSALSSVTTTFVKLYREHKLREAFATTDAGMQATFGQLRTLGGILDQNLRLAEHLRGELVRRLANDRADTAFAQVEALGDAYELAGDDDTELQDLRQSLTRYRAAIDDLAAAHRKLAELAGSHASGPEVEKALSALETTTDQLFEMER